jgi:WD40 repeat protein
MHFYWGHVSAVGVQGDKVLVGAGPILHCYSLADCTPIKLWSRQWLFGSKVHGIRGCLDYNLVVVFGGRNLALGSLADDSEIKSTERMDWILDVLPMESGFLVGFARNFVEVLNFDLKAVSCVSFPDSSLLFCFRFFNAMDDDCFRVAGGSGFKEIIVWDGFLCGTHKLDCRFEAHEGSVFDIRFASRNVLVSVSDDRTVKVWRIEDDHQVVSLFCGFGHPTRVFCCLALEMKLSGKQLFRLQFATGGEDGTVRFWEINPSGSCQTRSIQAHCGSVWAMCNVGGFIISGSKDNSVCLLRNSSAVPEASYSYVDVQTLPKRTGPPAKAYVRNLYFLDTEHLIIICNNGCIFSTLVNNASKLACDFLTDDELTSSDTHVESKLLAVGTHNGTILLFRFGLPVKLLSSCKSKTDLPVVSLKLVSIGRTCFVVSLSQMGCIDVWMVEDHKLQRYVSCNLGCKSAFCCAEMAESTGVFLLISDTRGFILAFKMPDKALASSLLEPLMKRRIQPKKPVEFSISDTFLDEPVVFAASHSGSVVAFKMQISDEEVDLLSINEFIIPSPSVERIWRQNGKLLCAGLLNKSLVVFDLLTNQEVIANL